MKLFFLLLSIVIIGSSCEKSVLGNVSLRGTWKMVLVKDNTTGALEVKPSTIDKEVIIILVPAGGNKGIFSGKTPSNDFGPNEYLLGRGQTISTPNLSMTKVAETSWGELFVNNIRNTKQYSFEADGKLILLTTTKVLTFQKL